MRGPKPEEMQEPAGNTIAWAVVLADEGRNWAEADAEANIAAKKIASPRIIPALKKTNATRNSKFGGNAAMFRCAFTGPFTSLCARRRRTFSELLLCHNFLCLRNIHSWPAVTTRSSRSNSVTRGKRSLSLDGSSRFPRSSRIRAILAAATS
jgi:hypothetical protein